MKILTTKDFIIAIALSFAVWIFGGFVIGFLGAAFGVPPLFQTALIFLLYIAAPLVYLMKRINEK